VSLLRNDQQTESFVCEQETSSVADRQPLIENLVDKMTVLHAADNQLPPADDRPNASDADDDDADDDDGEGDSDGEGEHLLPYD